MHALVVPTINLVLLIGIITYYTRKPLREFISNRHTSVSNELRAVSAQLKDAQERFEEFSSKLKNMDVEISALRERAKQDADTIKLRLLSDARRVYASVVSDSRTAADALFIDFKTELQKSFGTRVVERAESILRDKLTGDDRLRISREFSRQVESLK